MVILKSRLEDMKLNLEPARNMDTAGCLHREDVLNHE